MEVRKACQRKWSKHLMPLSKKRGLRKRLWLKPWKPHWFLLISVITIRPKMSMWNLILNKATFMFMRSKKWRMKFLIRVWKSVSKTLMKSAIKSSLKWRPKTSAVLLPRPQNKSLCNECVKLSAVSFMMNTHSTKMRFFKVSLSVGTIGSSTST